MQDTSSSDIRRCENRNCKKPLVRRENEEKWAWDVRRHCNQACARDNPDIRAKFSETFRLRREAQQKTCVFCNKKFHRNQDQSTKVFEEQQTCSITCRLAYRAQETEKRRLAEPPKICTVCGKKFYRRPKETPSRFRGRKTCGGDCGRQATADTKANNPSTSRPKPKPKPKKDSTIKTLPPPPPPGPTVIKIWRPGTWGGPTERIVNQ